MSRIARASLIIAFFFGVDKILGLLRQILFNRQFGPVERDIFFVSNNIPDLLSALISGGALGIALIPVLTEHLQEKDRQDAWRLFSRILNLAFLVTAGISLVIIALADPLIRFVIAPGFADPSKWTLTASLMRLDMFAILIFSISGLVMAGLQANQHFLTPAMAPAMYNLGQIIGITLLSRWFGIYGMVFGVILGASLHLGVQIPALIRYGYRWRPIIGLSDPGVRQVLVLLGPRVLSMLCLHFYFLARDRFASYYQEGGVSALNNGWFIMQLPETLIGTAIAIAMLPSLAEYVTRGEEQVFRQTINRALRAMLALTLPAAAILGVCIRPLIQIVFDFGPQETEMVVWATRAFLLGLVGHSWLEVGVRSWYAKQNARIPLLGAVFQIGLYLPMAIILSQATGLPGLALADTLAFTSQALLLLILLNQRHPGILRVQGTLLRASLSALLGGVLAFAVLQRSLPVIPALGLALAVGGLAALPLILPEIKMLIKL
ncbi:MAG: murein biosynthesis integral membrane protein MurJ [Chloroflexi bacterium RBG_16_57_11]|nr:MAG: murein biosynthesis integral membrane protein MurJ [Chloroflexi bacterium RBG_16_57_11]